MGRKPCCDKVGLKRGPWTIEEDQKLMNFILDNGIQCWRTIPKLAGLQRCGKSCRLRWINYLRPDLKRGAFSEWEEEQIIQLHSRLGNRWSKIASHFPGRTDNEIKNHWNTKIKKKLKLLGLEPVTHHAIVEPTKDVQDNVDKTQVEPNSLKEYSDWLAYANLQEGYDDQMQKESTSITCNLVNDCNTAVANSCFVYSPSFSVDDNSLNHPASGTSSVNQESVNVLQWVDSVDSMLSWDGFSHLGDEFLFQTGMN